jgi:glutamyl-tRNA reductase
MDKALGAGDLWKTYHKTSLERDVVFHLFQVASGLDSQMIGENQIINQLKAAYTMSIEKRTSKFFFHRLMHNAFRVSKAVRTQTAINCGAVSISLAAIELARRSIDLAGAHVLLIGAGENAALAAKYLVKSGIGTLTIASRTLATARELSGQLKTGHAILLPQVPEYLAKADLVISSTASPEPVITLENTKVPLNQRKKPLLLIDIAVPRDISPDITEHPRARLFNIDDLHYQIELNKAAREEEVPKAVDIVQQQTNRFLQWLGSLDTAEVISQLTRKYMAYARQEAQRYEKDFAETDREKLSLFAESLARKILHGPISFLKDTEEHELSSQQLHAVDQVKTMLLKQTEDTAEGSGI